MTPMMQQYLGIGADHPDALFYRMGDFASFFRRWQSRPTLLDITLTARGHTGTEPIPMCGVPYHSADGYLARLVKLDAASQSASKSVTPRPAKALSKDRFSACHPGTLTDDALLKPKPTVRSRQSFSGETVGLALLNLSSAQLQPQQLRSPDACLTHYRHATGRDFAALSHASHWQQPLSSSPPLRV